VRNPAAHGHHTAAAAAAAAVPSPVVTNRLTTTAAQITRIGAADVFVFGAGTLTARQHEAQEGEEGEEGEKGEKREEGEEGPLVVAAAEDVFDRRCGRSADGRLPLGEALARRV